jgi:diacylglycerol kinase family enzyme
MDRTLIVVNPKARDGRISETWPQREKEILRALAGVNAEIFWTTSEDFGARAVRNALVSGIQRIVVVGGDGTLTEALQGFFEKGVAIAPKAVLLIMPAGRGDDFFKTLANQRFFRGQSAWNFALDVLEKGVPKKIDVGSLQWLNDTPSPSRAFINIASFGYPGLVVHKVQAKEGYLAKTVLGKSAWAYVLQGISAYREYRTLEMKVSVDETVFYQGKVFSGFVLNGRYNAGGICWDPAVKVDDGLFHLLLMKNPWGSPIRAKAKKIQVEIMDDRPKKHPYFEVDGELLEGHETRGAVFQILPQALNVQFPKDSLPLLP